MIKNPETYISIDVTDTKNGQADQIINCSIKNIGEKFL